MAPKKQPTKKSPKNGAQSKEVPPPPPVTDNVEEAPTPAEELPPEPPKPVEQIVTKVCHICLSKSDKFVNKLQDEIDDMLSNGWVIMTQSHSVGDAGMGRAYSVVTVYSRSK